MEEFIWEEEQQNELEEVEHESGPSVAAGSRKRKSDDNSYKCHNCSHSYKNFDTFKRHVRLHIAEDLYKSAPGLEAAVEFCRQNAKDILCKMKSTDSESDLGLCAAEIASQLHTQAESNIFRFVDALITELWSCFPAASKIELSTLNSKYVLNVAHLLSDLDKRKDIADNLRDAIQPINHNKDGKVIDWFVTDFVMKLADAVEVFYIKALSNPQTTILARSSEDGVEENVEASENVTNAIEKSVKFKQTIHYIGGSVVKSAIRLALRSKGTTKWDNISQCLRDRFLCGELAGGVDKEISKWTGCRSRGGLIFVNELCWSFFMAPSGILESNEKGDGSLIQSEILTVVKDDDVLMFLWSDLVGDMLSEDENETLLANICRFFVNAWGTGVALRRKNDVKGRSRDKVPLRSSLCTK